jgi:cytochrome P450
MEAASLELDELNLTDPAFFARADPDDILRRLRHEDPVHWTQSKLGRPYWSVTKYAHVKHVYANDYTQFSSQRWGPALPVGMDWENPVPGDMMSLFQAGAQLASMDNEPHANLRRALSRRFLRPSLLALEETIRKLAQEIVNDVLPRGECDFAHDIAGRLPIALISHIMDIPREDWDRLARYAYMTAAPSDPEFQDGTIEETAFKGVFGLTDYCTKLALERRQNPGDDLLSDLGAAKLDGEYLSNLLVGFNGLAFFSAGHETTRNALCGGVAQLIGQDKDEWQRLIGRRNEQAMMLAAADECVRWSSPLTHNMRTATTDLELGGKQIREGDWVVTWNCSANRDEDIFDAPYTFDAGRANNPHLGFAYGPHMCLGANLARMEMRIMLSVLLDSVPDLELDGEPEIAASLIFRGIKRMKVRFTPRAPLAL